MANDGASIGEIYIDILPKADGFFERVIAQTRAQASKAGDTIGKQMGQSIQDAIARGFRDGVEKGGRESKTQSTKAGEESGAAFGRGYKARLTAALRDLPKVKLDADSTDADRSIAILRAQIASLRDAKIGVDIDAATAQAQLDLIKSKLADLEDEHPDIEVQASVVRAFEELERIKVLAREVAGESPTIHVDVDAGAATTQLAGIAGAATAVGALAPTIDVDVDTGAAVAQLGAMQAASASSHAGLFALVGAGALIGPAIVPAAAAATAAIGAIGPAAIAGGAGIGVLALAIVPVVGALKAADQAQQQAGTSAVSAAARQVALANAADQVKNAEQSLANAQQQVLSTQQALTRARQDAAKAMEDLNLQVADGALAQRQANLDLEKAKQELDATLANPAATKLQREQAQLTYDQAKQHITDLGVRQQRLVAQQQDAQRVGVDGSQQVQGAQRALAQAQQQVESATRQVAAAHRAAGQAAVAAGGTGSAAMTKLGESMAALSPAGRVFVGFIQSIKPIFTQMSQAAQTGFLPGLQAGMTALLPVMPQVVGLVGTLARTMGDLSAAAGPVVAQVLPPFLTMIGQTAPPLMRSFSDILLNIGVGFAGIMQAFAPFAVEFFGGIANMTRGFATFGQQLGTSSGFHSFMDYVHATGPKIIDIIRQLAIFGGHLVEALAPFGSMVLDGLRFLADGLARIPVADLRVIAGGVLLVAGAVGVYSAAMAIAAANPVSLIIVGVGAVIVGLIELYRHVEGFRNVVDTVFHAVATTSVWLWQNVLQPTFTWLKTELPVVGQFFSDLWTNYISPALGGIGTAISFAWNNLIRPAFDGLSFVITQVLAPTFTWLWRNVIDPVWQGIQLVISIASAAVQVALGLIEIYIKAVLAPVFTWLWRNVIEPVWQGISTVISSAWNNLIKPVLTTVGGFIHDYVAPAFRSGVDAIAAAWNGLREAARVPIAFVVNSIINPLIHGYNELAGAFGVHQVKAIQGFATGGYISGPGGPRDDAILARLSAGEYIIPANVVASLGVRFFDGLIGSRGSQARYPGDGSAGIAFPAFADGGLVGWAKDVWNASTNPTKLIKGPAEAALRLVPGAGALHDVVVGMGRRLVDGLVSWLGGAGNNGNAPGDLGKAQAFVKAQVGKPYGWAQAGPDAYDCSGIGSAAWLTAHGRQPYNHVFSTMNEAGFFPKPGYGPFTAAWTNPGERGVGGGPNGVGHTAFRIGTMTFESVGGQGVRVGSGVTPLSSFAHVGTYDSGGDLPPGLTIAYNGTGQTEQVYTAEDHARAQDAMAKGGRVFGDFHVHGSDGMSVNELVDKVIGEIAWHMR